MVKYLVEEKNADVNAKDNYGNTPLHWAAGRGHLPVVRYLIEKGAKVDAMNILGQTPCDLTNDEGIKVAMEYCVGSGVRLGCCVIPQRYLLSTFVNCCLLAAGCGLLLGSSWGSIF